VESDPIVANIPTLTTKGQKASEPIQLHIHGGARLAGQVAVDGSKNAALPLLAAAATLTDPVVLSGLPTSSDVEVMLGLLRRGGWTVSHDHQLGETRITSGQTAGSQPELPGAASIRASYYLVAPMLAAYGHASLPWPGGCSVGTRGMELHFAVYEAFGDEVEIGAEGYTIRTRSPDSRAKTVSILLPFRSRGATVAALLRSLVAGQPVIIGNPNLSAELHNLCRALTSAGCEVELDAARQIRMMPGQAGRIINWHVPGDKIEAGTLACALAATGGEGSVTGVAVDDIAPLLEALTRLGIRVEVGATKVFDDTISKLTICGSGEPPAGSLRAVASLAPGGLDADWEPSLLALALGVRGTHYFADSINPGRHGNLIPQLRGLGAIITESSQTECQLAGPQALTAAHVQATDIRTGSALLIAALTAVGTTTLTGMEQLRRGHADLPGKLLALGAKLDGGQM
jgi:UDP-N-acetylglucosamine 1-carboxyvinyltransferase